MRRCRLHSERHVARRSLQVCRARPIRRPMVRCQSAQQPGQVTMTCPACTEKIYVWTRQDEAPANGNVVEPPDIIECKSCRKVYSRASGRHFDLCLLKSENLDSGTGSPVLQSIADSVAGAMSPQKPSQSVYKERLEAGSQIFRSPFVSFVYERGWRQGFDWAGFPGVDKEFDLLLNLYDRTERRSNPTSDLVLDVSCGTGLFSRKFCTTDKFSTVIASDLSETMLEQTYNFVSEKVSDASSNNPLLLVRADVGRLPFPSNSFDLVHAGAAIHCWPNPSLALAEIIRVLKPGGRFIGSTFLLAASPLGQALGGDDVVRPLFQLEKELMRGSRAYRFWEEQELRELTELCGMDFFEVERSNRFIMFCATKPLPVLQEEEEEKDMYSKVTTTL